MEVILLLFLVGLLFVVFYMYKIINDLKLNYIQISNENVYLKSRVEDLNTYKSDVSKTFEILNNDLKVINEELKKNDFPNTNTENHENPENNQHSTGNIRINPAEIFTQSFLRQNNSNPANDNVDQFTDQIMNTVSRYLVHLSN